MLTCEDGGGSGIFPLASAEFGGDCSIIEDERF